MSKYATFDELYEAERTTVRRIIQRRIPYQDVEDAEQEVWARAVRYWSRVKDHSGYLFSICATTVVSYHRKASKQPAIYSLDATLANTPVRESPIGAQWRHASYGWLMDKHSLAVEAEVLGKIGAEEALVILEDILARRPQGWTDALLYYLQGRPYPSAQQRCDMKRLRTELRKRLNEEVRI